MLSNLLSSTNPTREVPVEEAALYALLGFAIVCIGIVFLIFIVWLVGKIMTKLNPKTPKAEKLQPEVKAVAPTALTVPTEAVDELSDETVAVIMAALMAYYQTNNPKCEFTVKRIKRI